MKSAGKLYLQAKKNLSSLCTSEAAALRQACSLNLMSCYLKTGEFDKTIAEGIEVLAILGILFIYSTFLVPPVINHHFCQILASDENNLKALYRRGQAYRELGKLSVCFLFLHFSSSDYGYEQ
jgi:hypothetical protein